MNVLHWIFAAAPLLVLPFGASATPQCTVASEATMDFGVVVALASTGDVATDSGASFWINCTSDVSSSPSIFSSTVRSMSSGAAVLPFRLSMVSPGGADLPTTSPGTAVGIARNGTNQVVVLFGKIRAGDFRSLQPGLYSNHVTVTIEY